MHHHHLRALGQCAMFLATLGVIVASSSGSGRVTKQAVPDTSDYVGSTTCGDDCYGSANEPACSGEVDFYDEATSEQGYACNQALALNAEVDGGLIVARTSGGLYVYVGQYETFGVRRSFPSLDDGFKLALNADFPSANDDNAQASKAIFDVKTTQLEWRFPEGFSPSKADLSSKSGWFYLTFDEAFRKFMTDHAGQTTLGYRGKAIYGSDYSWFFLHFARDDAADAALRLAEPQKNELRIIAAKTLKASDLKTVYPDTTEAEVKTTHIAILLDHEINVDEAGLASLVAMTKGDDKTPVTVGWRIGPDKRLALATFVRTDDEEVRLTLDRSELAAKGFKLVEKSLPDLSAARIAISVVD